MIFISHNSDDREKLVLPLVKSIESISELKTFVAELNPNATYLRNKIVPQLDVCWALVLLFTRKASKSQWVNQEIGFVAKKWWPNPPKVILVLEQGIKPKAFLEQMEIVYTIDSADTVEETQMEDMVYKVLCVLRKEIPQEIPLHLRVNCSCGFEKEIPLPSQKKIDGIIERRINMEFDCERCNKRIYVNPKTLISS